MSPELPPQVDPDEKLLPTHKSSAGPLISIIIIVTLLFVGGIYFLKNRVDKISGQSHFSSASIN